MPHIAIETFDSALSLSLHLNPDNVTLGIEDFEELNGWVCPAAEEMTVDGRAPLWLYMLAGIRGFRAGVRRILVVQAGTETPHCVYPVLPSETVSEVPPVSASSLGDGVVVLECNDDGGALIADGDIPSVLSAVPSPAQNEHTLILTGSMPNFAAVALAIRTLEAGWGYIGYWTPRNTAVYQIHPWLATMDTLPIPQEHGFAIGILGDPNSGKSVFADLLEHAMRLAGKRVWKLDCDYAAPTPKWYLEMLRKGDVQAGTALRRQYKQPWTKKGEQQMAEAMKTLKAHLPYVIADFPGGCHKDSDGRPLPPDQAQRVPDGREVMLYPLDGFIIIAIPGRHNEIYWKRELARLGLEERVLLIIYSQRPKAPLSVERHPDGTVFIQGLDRSHSLDDP